MEHSKQGTEPGSLIVRSNQTQVEVLSDYNGPLTEAELGYKLPKRSHSRGQEMSIQATLQVDGRTFEQEERWSGLRCMMRIDSLNVDKNFSTFNLFTTHLGKTVSGKAYWTEIGFIRSAQDPAYRLFTYDPYQKEQYKFFGEARLGQWYEFAIRLAETGQGSYHYETFCNGTRVREGQLPVLANQFDLSHETWTDSGKLSPGDFVAAEECWVNFPPNKARWFAPDIKTSSYSTSPMKQIKLYQPKDKFAYRFESRT